MALIAVKSQWFQVWSQESHEFVRLTAAEKGTLSNTQRQAPAS